MAQIVEIKTADPRMALGLSEGANAIALQRVSAECEHFKALDGVRRYGDSVRWESVAGALAVKYSIRPVGRVRGAVLGAWALVWLGVVGWFEYFRAWNREA